MNQLSDEQLDTLRNVKRVLCNLKDAIHDVCQDEKPEITLGYTLGGIGSSLMNIWDDMSTLLNEIQEQNEQG